METRQPATWPFVVLIVGGSVSLVGTVGFALNAVYYGLVVGGLVGPMSGAEASVARYVPMSAGVVGWALIAVACTACALRRPRWRLVAIGTIALAVARLGLTILAFDYSHRAALVAMVLALVARVATAVGLAIVRDLGTGVRATAVPFALFGVALAVSQLHSGSLHDPAGMALQLTYYGTELALFITLVVGATGARRRVA